MNALRFPIPGFRFNFLIFPFSLLTACGSIDPPPPVNDEGEPIPFPAPYETWLQIKSIAPATDEDIPLQPVLEITFTDYIDPATFTTYGVLALQSGGIIAAGDVEYSMAERTLRWTPRRLLEPGFAYRLVLFETGISSVTGSPLIAPARMPRYIVDEDATIESTLPRQTVRWADIEPIFDAKCASCHGDARWGLPELTHDVLVDTRSEQVEHMLVRPFDPTRSYLMHKILPDYPLRRFTVQPPPWFEERSPLSDEEIGLIEAWIRQGAR
ncbi:MAG: hypothetical protein ACNA8W_12520 [Bradymonadaceae bacterium]